MPHIQLPTDIPGMRSLFAFRPETAAPITALAQILLHAPNSLTRGERELIAARVSALNECTFCRSSHAAIVACHLGDEALVASVVRDPDTADITPKLKALMEIAARVQQGGRAVLKQAIDRARDEGATDIEIHDTVLIAALFCLCNRYVDGLATWTPEDPDFYRERAALVAEHGYISAVAAPSADSTSPRS